MMRVNLYRNYILTHNTYIIFNIDLGILFESKNKVEIEGKENATSEGFNIKILGTHL